MSAIRKRVAGSLGALAILFSLFIVVGILLPGTVQVTRSVEIDASPEEIFPLLGNLETWAEWTPWGDVESRVEGPASGLGARRVWDDPGIGSGTLTLTGFRPPQGVDYVVEVEDGAIRFEGTLSIEEREGKSFVSWTERADLGWNPLLGWTALGMEDAQGRQLQESLDRLQRRIKAPPDGSRTPPDPTSDNDLVKRKPVPRHAGFGQRGRDANGSSQGPPSAGPDIPA